MTANAEVHEARVIAINRESSTVAIKKLSTGEFIRIELQNSADLKNIRIGGKLLLKTRFDGSDQPSYSLEIIEKTEKPAGVLARNEQTRQEKSTKTNLEVPPGLPSLQLIELLEELIAYWEDCGYSKDYYIRVLIPSVQSGKHNVSGSEEGKLISAVERTVTSQKGDLSEIARNLKKYRRFITQTTERIYKLFEQGRFDDALVQFGEVKDLYSRACKLYAKMSRSRISSLLDARNFTSARSEIERCRSLFPVDEYSFLVRQVEDAKAEEERLQHLRFKNAQIERIKALLNEYRFDEAAGVYETIKNEYRIEDYQALEDQSRLKHRKDKFIRELEVLFDQMQYGTADQAFLNSNLINEKDYLQIKSTHLANTLGQYGKDAKVNDEQAIALAHFNHRLLVKARAGSGKTRLLTAKTLLLVDFEGVHPDNILIMAFNRDAASTVKARIKGLAKTNQTKAFENARTFHSLARQIVQPSGKLLFDDKGDFVRKEFSEFVQSIFRELVTPGLSVRLYEFFRREMMSVQRSGALMNDKDYYLYIRSQRYSTLRGDKVKSIGEKFIADFLFEHNLGYAYEKDYIWDGRVYHPDFSLFIDGNEFIIEHWGIDENDPEKSVSENWDRGWDDYHEEMQEKRAYWDERSESNEKKNFILIETSVVDLKNGRAAFEDILKSRLTSKGIICEKLPERELIQKVFRMQIDRMTNLLVQFIFKAKKRRWNAAETKKQVVLFPNVNAKTRFFLELGCMVYEAYETKIQRLGKIDFDELVNQAIQRIHSSRANIFISADGTSSRQFNLSNLEWLLIDEYQDFSPLFYDLVDAIQTYNPKLKIICVGDDWQAINSFAGSDLSYFNEYQSFFPDARVVPLTINYRSKSAIVDAGNQIMQGNGNAGNALPSNFGGNVYIDDIEVVKLPYRNGDEAENNPDVRYLFFDKVQDGSEKLRSNGFMVGKYLKACHQIISNAKNRSKSFVILSRNNQIYGIDLVDFLAKLKSILSKDKMKDGDGILSPNIRISTVHSYKGLEADCVILLQACQGYFPSIHPDNKLFEVFGQTEKMVLDEERRLFYVAVTRAREKLFILTENSRRSDFLSSIQATPFFNFQENTW